MTELLAPAGDFETFKYALYNGADAIYLAGYKYGARAYAKNFSLDELDEALTLAHSLNKKVYVTVNTLVKDCELNDCYNYLNELYELGVDAIIAADFAVISYIITKLPLMECHISTQAGIKNLDDVLFYDSIHAKRCVLAREMSIDEIKKIKENSNMPLEVFAHGALCVSYSGGCLMSSFLSLRSGNRGRCSQNCRRAYTLYKDGKKIGEKGFHLSMKDLNSSSNIKELIDLGVDSLKLEGRMKDFSYVQTITKEYRKVIDDSTYIPTKLDSIFHRSYTKGFLFNEDRKNIVDPLKKSNEGELIGTIEKYNNNLCTIKLIKEIKLKDRIRIASNEDYYFNIDKIYVNKKAVEKANNTCEIEIYKDFELKTELYRMTSKGEKEAYDNTYKQKIDIVLEGTPNNPLQAIVKINDKSYNFISSFILDKSINRPLDYDSLYKQFKKLNETSFYLNNLQNKCSNDIFTSVGQLNDFRRTIISSIEKSMHGYRKYINYNLDHNEIKYEKGNTKIACFATTEQQYEACIEEGIDVIYYNNYIPYVGKQEIDFKENYILAGNVGALYRYKDKDIVADYSFNAFNSDTLYNLYSLGVKRICPSVELTYLELKNMVTCYKEKYKYDPSLEIMCYGHINLMTMKYCPLKRFNECSDCANHTYSIKDDFASFPISHKNCITHIYNGKALNLIDDLNDILTITDVIRLNFTIEDKAETKRIIKMYKDKLLIKNNKKQFNSSCDTRGYFRREVQ